MLKSIFEHAPSHHRQVLCGISLLQELPRVRLIAVKSEDMAMRMMRNGVRMRSCGGVVGGIKTASNAQVALKILWLLGWSIGCLAQVSQDCFYILLLL